MVAKMPADRVRPSVQPLPRQLFPQRNDQFRYLIGDHSRAGLRPPRPRRERRLPSSARYRATSLLTQPWETL